MPIYKQRERLVELLEEADKKVQEYILENDHMDWIPKSKELSEVRADFLLANGVIVPPCKVGQTVYSIDNCINRPEMIVVTSIHHHKKHTFFSALSRSQREYCFEEKDIGKTVFLTKEEAEEAVKDGAK